MKSVKALAARLVLVVIGGAFACGLFFVFIQLFDGARGNLRVSPRHYESLKDRLDYNPRSLYQMDKAISYRFKPSYEGIRHGTDAEVHRTNLHGLLGDREVPESSEHALILFLGDSVTYGDGLPFDAIFSSRLEELAHGNVLVFNGGCPGWSTHQQITYYNQYLKEIEWDAVFIVFCLNDLVKFEWVYGDEKNFRMAPEVEANGGMSRVTAAMDSIQVNRIRKRFAANPRTAPLATQNNTTLFAWHADKWDEYIQDVLIELTGTNSIKGLHVVASPSVQQLLAYQKGAPIGDVFYPQQRLEAFCETNQIPFFDFADVFAGPANPGDYFHSPLHMNAAGHERVARWLYEKAIQQL